MKLKRIDMILSVGKTLKFDKSVRCAFNKSTLGGISTFKRVNERTIVRAFTIVNIFDKTPESKS